MTILTGAFRDIAGKMAQGTVTLVSQVTRPANSSAGQVVTEERHVIRLVDGAFVSPELDPGPIRVELSVSGAGDNFEVFEISLPEDGRHDLADLIDLTVDWSPGVVGRVEAAAADANRAAQAAGQSATKAAQAEATVIAVVADGAEAVRAELRTEIDGASQARIDAQAAQAAAEAAASRAAADVRAEIDPLIDVAAGHESAAAESARQARLAADASRVDADRASVTVSTAAGQLRQEVQAHVAAATVAEASAAGSAAAAKNSADAAADSESSAAASAVEAGDVKVLVDTAAEQASGSATQAAGFAEAAAGSATSAGSAKSAAEAARDEAVQAAESAQTSAPPDGWPRTSLSSDVRDSLTRADTALTSVPRATTSTPGGVQLTGDLGGTWDAPRVPGLASKMDAQPVSDAATSSTLVKRTSGATIKTARPQADDDAANRKYVDDTVGATRAEMQARPAMWLWDGKATWQAPANAVATDNVLNLTTGEIHSVKEVV